MARTKKAQLVKRDQIAEALDVNAQTIVKWHDEGFPIARRGRRGVAHLYDLGECRRWKGAREEQQLEEPINLAYERARKERAQALLHEQKFAMLSGQLLRADEVEKEWGRVVAVIRGKLLAWPSLLADRLQRASRKGVAMLEAELDAAARELLEELASGRENGNHGEPEDGAKKASACGAPTKSGAKCLNPAGEDGRCHIPSHQSA